MTWLVLYLKERISHIDTILFFSSGIYFLFQDTIVWRIESIQAMKDMPLKYCWNIIHRRILIYLRHFYM